jgi:hypothetical protein
MLRLRGDAHRAGPLRGRAARETAELTQELRGPLEGEAAPEGPYGDWLRELGRRLLG